MANYYVSTTGNNSNAGTSTAGAWLTFGRAASAGSGLIGGDVVNFLDGTYNEQVFIAVSGASKTNRITYQAINKWGAKVVATGILTSTNTTAALRITGDNIIVRNMDITGPGAIGINCSGNWNRIEGCNIHDIPATGCTGFGGAGIGFDQYNVKEGGSAIGNMVHSIGPLGTNCFRVHGIYTSIGKVTMDNNIIYKVVGYGFTQGHCSYSINCVNNTVFACGGTAEGGGIVFTNNTNCSKPSNNNVVANNIIYDCVIGVHEEGVNAAVDTTIYANNLVFGCTTNWGVMFNSHHDDINAAPGFINYQANGTGDYHLSAGSAAINAGTATSAPSIDFDGVARPIGTKYDLGAYEYGVAAPDTTAPILTLPIGAATGASTADIGVTTNEGNGVMYYWATTNPIETAASIIANGGSFVPTDTGGKLFSVSGLNPLTIYYGHFVQKDAALNQSNVVHSLAFTTLVAVVGINIPTVSGNFRRRFHIS